MRFLLAFTIGLPAFLAIDALLEGTELAGSGPGSRVRRARLPGAAGAYLALAAGRLAQIPAGATVRRGGGGGARAFGYRAAFLVALGIGLHNLGRGSIGSAYAIGSLALGAALVVGFALHNTTEGLGDRRLRGA